MSGSGPKVVRSYRVVFRRRWRIFRLQNWRIPLPGGLELRAIGYWLASLGTIVVLGRMPGIGPAIEALPSSVRLVALPIAAAWGFSSWEIDGRSPHRAAAGILMWRLRPRVVAGLRRCPPPGSVLAPPWPVTMRPDLAGSEYPRGRLVGPARVLLRYPVAIKPEKVPRGAGHDARARAGAARRWRVRATGQGALQKGHTVDIPAGKVVVFE